MLRRLVNLLATVSLILAFTSIVFWIRSYQYEEAVCYGHPNETAFYQLTSQRGLLAIERVDVSGLPNEFVVDTQRGLWAYSLPEKPELWVNNYGRQVRITSRWVYREVQGLRQMREPRPAAKQFIAPADAIAVPFWTVSGLLLLLPIARMAPAVQARRRRQSGLCPQCGYDLRESPERCPECGTPVQPS